MLPPKLEGMGSNESGEAAFTKGLVGPANMVLKSGSGLLIGFTVGVFGKMESCVEGAFIFFTGGC
jgi:hypothetical protein